MHQSKTPHFLIWSRRKALSVSLVPKEIAEESPAITRRTEMEGETCELRKLLGATEKNLYLFDFK